ncbi:prophage regulatory protein [Rhodoblastus acidophilus]|uniref:helix-turn-helix transcriptional regulator n=1 Tax=Rhodoblastus acidophilus TaxID=1074 RepID=UPI0022247AA0|nr:AlpA family phage regulatory protein [Rhodoblastus acidophilus]MCW2285683.1 prophage regulatory protein [Rhodoblastus acidophilus]MCW2333055.1 prophage regulatory protein [Rhodoblastus acidophilus]
MMKILRFSDLKARGIVGNRVTLSRWIAHQNFPRGIKLSERSVGWIESEIEAWLKQRAAMRGAGSVEAA